MEVAILIAITYLLTGIALTVYDFAAPALHQKMYVIKKDFRVATLNWFIWPYSACFDAYQESKLGRSGARFIFGVVGLAVGIFMWSMLIFILFTYLTGLKPVAYLTVFILGVLSSAIGPAMTMPPHGK